MNPENFFSASPLDRFLVHRLLDHEFCGEGTSDQISQTLGEAAGFRQFCVRIHPDVGREIDDVVASLGVTSSSWARMVLAEGIVRSKAVIAAWSDSESAEFLRELSKPKDETASDLPGQADKGDKTVSKGQTKNA